MRHDVSKTLYDYWNRVRAGKPAPNRNDIEPGAIRAVLPDTFVVDLDRQSGFPFRIAGSRITSLFLTDLLGTPFLRLWKEPHREEMQAILQRVASDAAPWVMGCEAGPPGLKTLEFEVTLLPLRHKGSTQSRMLGSIAAFAAPHWLGLIGSGPATLLLHGAVDDTPSAAKWFGKRSVNRSLLEILASSTNAAPPETRAAKQSDARPHQS